MTTAETANTNHQNEREVAKNIDETERLVSGIGGALLAAYGLYRMDLLGLAILAGGSALIYRAADGFGEIYDWLEINLLKVSDAKTAEAKETAEKSADAPPLAAEKSATARAAHKRHSGTRIEKDIIVHRPLAEIFAFWRNFENLPQVMSHLQKVRVIDDKRSRWTAKVPPGAAAEWEAEIFDEQKNHYIAWHSVQGSEIETNGSVRFDRAGSGATKITVIINFTPPAGVMGTAGAALFGENPAQQLEDDLQNFKTQMENPGSGAIM